MTAWTSAIPKPERPGVSTTTGSSGAGRSDRAKRRVRRFTGSPPTHHPLRAAHRPGLGETDRGQDWVADNKTAVGRSSKTLHPRAKSKPTGDTSAPIAAAHDGKLVFSRASSTSTKPTGPAGYTGDFHDWKKITRSMTKVTWAVSPRRGARRFVEADKFNGAGRGASGRRRRQPSTALEPSTK